MEYFCLIYPDAVFNGVAIKVVEQFSRIGIIPITRVVRKISLEEASTIFYARRLNPDFEQFCKAMTLSPVWLVRLHYDGDLPEALATGLNSLLFGEFYIPTLQEDNENFISLIGDIKASSEKIEEVIYSLREQINHRNHDSDLEFAAFAMTHGERLYSYFTTLRVIGFNKEQAFELTKEAQKNFLENSMSGEEEEEEEELNDDDIDDYEEEELEE